MTKDKWVWMPHAGHFICGHMCRFRMNTYVGKYIVSTVGEMDNDLRVKEIHAEIRDKEWFEKNKHLKGDYFNSAYFKRFGWEEIGCDRAYETMVFKAKKSDHKCCPYEIVVDDEVDFKGYKNAEEAFAGHYELCEKWSKE